MLDHFFLILLTIVPAYLFVGYPLSTFIMTLFSPKNHLPDDGFFPMVVLVLPLNHPEDVPANQLASTLAIDYPKDKLTFILVPEKITNERGNSSNPLTGTAVVCRSDGSWLATPVELTSCEISGEVVIYSDWHSLTDRHLVRRLAQHFSDDRIGFAVGYPKACAAQDPDPQVNKVSRQGSTVEATWQPTFVSLVNGAGANYAVRSFLHDPAKTGFDRDNLDLRRLASQGSTGICEIIRGCGHERSPLAVTEITQALLWVGRALSGIVSIPASQHFLRLNTDNLLQRSRNLPAWFIGIFLCGYGGWALMLADNRVPSSVIRVIGFIYGVFTILTLFGWWHPNLRKSAIFKTPYTLMLQLFASCIVIFNYCQKRTKENSEHLQRSYLPPRLMVVFPVFLCVILTLNALRLAISLETRDTILLGVIVALILAIIYSYVGYPLVLALIARLNPANVTPDDNFQPEVTLLIVAYNEEKEIEDKIKNCLTLDYPRNLLKIVVASDGSTDATNTIAEKFKNQGVNLIAYPQNRGKITALNASMGKIYSEIVVFSDANVTYDCQALRKLVRNFADPRVGVVSGRVRLLNDTLSYGDSEKAYYGIEHFIQEQEGKIGALVGGDGAMYAIRRSLFHPPPADTILDDLVIAMQIACAGFLVIHEKDACGHERNYQEIAMEFERKTRIIAGGFQYLLRGNALPPVSRPLLLFTFFSHKLLRWANGILIASLLLLLAFGCLASTDYVFLFQFLLSAMAGSLVVALVAHLLPNLKKIKLVNMLHYIYMLSLASLTGFFRQLTTGQKVTWREEV